METGILITHGTDTLAWTLPFLRYAIKNLSCNVCITGSQVPMERAMAWSDGFQNIHGAVRFLSVLEPPSVFAVFNNGTNAFSDSLAKVERWRGSAFIGDPIATMEWDEVQHRSGDARLREAVKLDRLHLITTGGTIDSSPGVDQPLQPLQPGGSIVEEFLDMAMPDACGEILVHALCAVDSAEMNRPLMERLVQEVVACAKESDSATELDLRFADDVAIIHCNPFRHRDDYLEAVDRNQAVVLAGYGGGNACADTILPENALEAVHLANEQGKMLVLSSQVPIGPADFVYKTAAAFIEAGAISGVDLSLPECQVRLMHILGHDQELRRQADDLGCPPDVYRDLLFLSGMKFRNRDSRRLYRQLSKDRVPLLPEDLLVYRPFEEAGHRVAGHLREDGIRRGLDLG